MLSKIPGNAIKAMLLKIALGMFKKIPGNVRKDSGECLGKLWGMLSILN